MRESDWFITDFYRVRDTKEYIIGDDYYGWKFNSCSEILSAIFSGTHFIQHNVVYKKKLWEKVGKYDETLAMAEDLDLYTRFLLSDVMPRYVPYVSHLHRFHATNVSIGVDAQHHKRDIIRLTAKYRKELIERGITL